MGTRNYKIARVMMDIPQESTLSWQAKERYEIK